MMKRFFVLVLMVAMLFCVCACGGRKDSHKLGDVIETDQFKITPSFTGYALLLQNVQNEHYLTPEGQPTSEKNPYSADEGKVFMYGEVQIEYIGADKSDVKLELDISADYDNGYVFEKENITAANCVTPDSKKWTEDPMYFEPLSSSTTRVLRYCIEVPEQVEINTNKPLSVTFRVNGKAFVYDFRSAEVRSSDYDPRAEFYQPVDAARKQQIIDYLKNNGLAEFGYYDKTVGIYTFSFTDTNVTATLPINSSYQYEFSGTYEIFSGTILITWHGEQMHLDYTFDGETLDVVSFMHGH